MVSANGKILHALIFRPLDWEHTQFILYAAASKGSAKQTISRPGGNALWGGTPASSFASEKSASRDNCRCNTQMFGLVDLYIYIKCRHCLSLRPWISFNPVQQRAAADCSIKTSSNQFFHRSYSKEAFFLL